MPSPRRHVPAGAFAQAFADLRAELAVPESFPDAVREAAAEAARRGPAHDRVDRRDIPLVTIDPPGSMDLDQALHVQTGPADGLTVSYAIADVAAFVQPGDAVDVEAWDRGVSRYSPDTVTPLHPRELSEQAASLLPHVDRPAVLWTLTVDRDGTLTDTRVERAMVRSRDQLTYAQAQQAIDRGTREMLVALSRLGRLRAEREWVRGGVSLDLPDQEVHAEDDGTYSLAFRAPLPVEGWNAHVSLLTGIAAGQMMVQAGVGVLRTLPAPEEATVQGLRQRAWALGLPWPPEIGYADFVRTLDIHHAREAAMVSLAAVGLRGAGYAAFDGIVPEQHRHEALASPYAHVTAPLRRLVDRYASEAALAISAGVQPPQWALDRLEALPRAMAQARSRASALDRAVLDLVEAHVLAPRVGERFAATVVRAASHGSDLQLRDPAVLARVEQDLPVGEEVTVVLTSVDLHTRTVRFDPV